MSSSQLIIAAVVLVLIIVAYMFMGAAADPGSPLMDASADTGSGTTASNVAPLGVPAPKTADSLALFMSSYKDPGTGLFPSGPAYSTPLTGVFTKDSAGKVSGTRFYAPSDSATSDVLVSGMNIAGCDGKFHYERTNGDGTIIYVTGGDLAPGQIPQRSVYNRADGSWACRGTDAGRSTNESVYYFDGRKALSSALNVTYL